MHAVPLELDCPSFAPGAALSGEIGSEGFVAAAGELANRLPDNVRQAIDRFRTQSHRSGALLIHGFPVGELPPTPATPTDETQKNTRSESVLLAVAKCLGEPVGYKPELGGRLVQNLVPTRANQDRQISTSSKVRLMFHTETSFHPYRPAYLLLLCLRGDDSAYTTLASIREILPFLSPQSRAMLFQPRFRTAVDTSFLNGRRNALGDAHPVLSGDRDAPSMVFDEELTVGMDEAAQAALQELVEAVKTHHLSVCLRQGDMLVVDNAAAVHGRTSFKPRFDGADRWLQRTFVLDTLPASNHREGRVITTVFGI